MTEYDPFNDAPNDEAQSAPAEPIQAEETVSVKKAAPKKAVGTVSVDVKPNLLPFDSEGKVVLTFKGGTGFDAPWIVIHAKDLQDAYDQVDGDNAVMLSNLMARVQKAGSHFAGKAPASQSANAGSGQRQAAPQAAQQAPGGEVRHCAHGEMRFRSGMSKAGKPYSAFFCSSGDRNNECRAQFLR